MHFENAIPLIDSALDFFGENLGRARPRPCRRRHRISHLLSQELIGRHFKVFAHDIVERHAKGHIEIIVQKVKRIAANQRFDFLGCNRRTIFVIAIANQPVIRMNFDHHMLIDIIHTRASVMVIVAFCQWHRNRDDFNIGDFHLQPPEKNMWGIDSP